MRKLLLSRLLEDGRDGSVGVESRSFATDSGTKGISGGLDTTGGTEWAEEGL